MTDIYAQHEATFSRVSAFVILRDGERVATVALKFPADGAGRLYAYVHWIGNEMVRGYAGGYGYDKRSAAVASAARKYIAAERKAANNIGDPASYMKGENGKAGFWHAIADDNGRDWTRVLEDAGFTVFQAV